MTMSDAQASAGISKHLSALATSYKNDYTNFSCEQVAVPLHQAGIVTGNFQRDSANWSDLAADVRVPGMPAAQLDQEDPSLVTFSIDEHAARVYLSERFLALRAQAGVSRDRCIENAVRRVSGALLTQREKRLANMLTTSGNYNASNAATVSTKWDNASGDPIADILAAIQQICKGPAKNSEFYAVADEGIWWKLMANAAVRKAIGGVTASISSFEELGRILHVRPVVCKATYGNTNAMYGNNFVIFRRPEVVAPDDEEAQCSFRLVHNMDNPIQVRTYTTDELIDNGFFVQASSNYAIINPYGDSAGKYNTAYLLAAPMGS